METLRLDIGAGTWWIYVLLAMAAVAAAWYSYRSTVPPLGSRDKTVLAGLRAVGLMLLLFTLFEPLLRIRQSETMEPRVAIAIDVSRSMRLRDRSIDRAVQTREAYQKLVEDLEDKADVFAFDQQVRPYTLSTGDSLLFNGFRSDIGKAIRFIGNSFQPREYGAVILVTDGNHNSGDNPVYPAEQSGLGVYTLGIGDSVAPSDARVASIFSSGLAVVQQPISISVDVEYGGMADGDGEVVLKDNNQVVSRQPIRLSAMAGTRRVSFMWTPTTDGIHKITAECTSRQKEFTLSNNSAHSFVKVQKNKRKVLLVAGAPSPDVTFIKAAVEYDPTVEVVTRIQRDGTTFYEGAIDASTLQDLQAIILVGYPTVSSATEPLERLAEKAKRTSLLFVPSLVTDYGKLSKFQEAIPFVVKSNRPQEVLVTPDVGASGATDPIMKIRGDESDVDSWNQLPPVYRTEMFVEQASNASVLASIKIGSAAIDEPLLIKSERNGVRSLAVLGYGLYRWKLLGQGAAASRGSAAVDVLQLFVGNAVKWLSIRDDEQRIRIRSTHETYAAGERIGFNAVVQDQTTSIVDDAEVAVEVLGSSGSQKIILSTIGNGQYAASLGSLPPGDYSYKGSAMRRGIVLGTDNGRFTVSPTSIEDAAVTMNSSLLQLIAQRSGAVFHSADKVDSLLQAIKNDARLQPIVRTSDREHALYHLPWFVAAALTAFSLEWFLRKRKGLV